MTKKDGIFGAPISRRSFLKGSLAAAAAMSASSAMAFAEDKAAEATAAAAQEQVFCGSCRGNCGGQCFLNIHVRDGKVVRTSARDLPDPSYNRICIKGLTQPYRIYGKDRLKYPLRRVGERGAGEWEQISWDEAIKTITDKWKGYIAEYGPESIGTFLGSGNYAAANGSDIAAASGRFKNAMGFCKIDPSVDAQLPMGLQPVLGTMGTLTGGNESKDLLNAKTILVWGANPVNSQQQTTHFMLEAKDNGTKLIVIDPIFTGTAAKADMHVQLQAGTDAVLGYAMMNVIIDNDLVDWDFVKAHTDMGMFVKADTKQYLRLSDVRALAEGEADVPVMMNQDGTFDAHMNVADPVLHGTFEVNGVSVTTVFDTTVEAIKEYTLEKAEEITKVPAAQIEEVAKLYATNTPSTIYCYFGVDHYVNGHYGYRAMASLAALTGNTGKPGAYCGMNESMGSNFLNFFAQYPADAIPSGLTISVNQLDKVLETGKYGETPVNLKSIYVAHGNMIGNSGNRQEILKAVKMLDFLVVADISMTESAQYADIVLPAAHWFEVNDVSMCFGTHPYTLLQEKAVEPLYECKGDFEIFKLLATAMGSTAFDGITEEDYCAMWMDTDGARAVGLTYEALKEKKAIKFVPGDNYVENANGVWATSTGKCHFYHEAAAPAQQFEMEFNYDHERLPHWNPPMEATYDGNAEYPFHYMQVHAKWRTHTQWFDVPVLEEVSGKPTVHMNPADAEAKGFVAGDVLKIYNERGYVVMPLVVNPAVPKGMVTVPHGFENGQFIDGHYQDLTLNVMHPISTNTGYFDAHCNVVKA